jgi:hypothetical protein
MTVRGSFSAKKRVNRWVDIPGRTSITPRWKRAVCERKGGIHLLRHYPEFRTIQGNRLPGFIFKESG